MSSSERGGFMMRYPGGSWLRKFFFKMPLYAWRLGMGWMLPGSFLVLGTFGRKSGVSRHTMLEYSSHEGHYYLWSGWGDQSHWYQNLMANPAVTVQPVRRAMVVGRATTDISDEVIRSIYPVISRSPYWKPYLAHWGIAPNIEDVIAEKDRLHVVTIMPDATVDAPAPLCADWWWVWLFALLGFVIGRVTVRR